MPLISSGDKRMYTSETPGGRERLKYLRFQLCKGVRIIASDVTFEGILIDVSVGWGGLLLNTARSLRPANPSTLVSTNSLRIPRNWCAASMEI